MKLEEKSLDTSKNPKMHLGFKLTRQKWLTIICEIVYLFTEIQYLKK